MDRDVRHRARFAATTCLVLLLAAAAGPGCGGDGTGIIGGGDAGPDGVAGDAVTDTTYDRSKVDARADRSTADVPADRTTADVPADRTTADVPADRTTADAPSDRSSADAPSDRSAADAPADAGCNSVSCPSGCCKGGASGTCEAYSAQSSSSCGTAGASCAACSSGTCTSGTCGVAAAVCGNGVRETGEQCDDGNLVDLDGCDSTCHFEQETRATRLVLQWAPDTFCTADALLVAVQSVGHSTLQGDVDTSVTAGTTNLLFKYFGITDDTGMSGTTSVGSYDGAPVLPYTGAFNGNADLDWWYTLNTATAGGSPLYTPTSIESAGTFTSGVLNASGGHVLLSAFGASLLDMASVKLQLPIASPASAPTASAGTPPGHLTSENLDPALTSFAKAGGTTTTPTGLLCGNVTAASLAATLVPATLQTGGADACLQGYGPTNDMLDVFVNGCTVTAIIFTETVITAVQPDQINPDAPAAGAGGPYKFQVAATHVDGCTDHTGAAVTPYTACFGPAAYSMYVKIAVDRVIVKH